MTLVEETSVLLSIAEVAATFAGFAALVTLFARRRVAGAAVHDLLRLRLVIGASVAALMAALIPVALEGFGLGAGLTWRISAVAFLLLTYLTIASFVASYRGVQDDFAPDRLAVAVAFVLEIFIQIGLILIVLGIAKERWYGLYVSALIGTIGQAAFVFLRLVESTFGIIVKPDQRDIPP